MPIDSTSSSGFADFIEGLKKWWVPILAVVAFIFGLPKVFAAARENITWAVLSVVGVGWLFLYWVYTSKTKSEILKTIDDQPKIEVVSRFSKWRRWALTGMVLSPIFVGFGFGIVEYFHSRPSNKTVVLIADFYGDDQKHAITQTVINRLIRATTEFKEVQIKPLGRLIKEQEGSELARRIGQENKAKIIVWGFYDEELNITVHAEIVPELYCSCSCKSETDFSPKTAGSQGISVKEQLSSEMNTLALLLVGLTRFNVGDNDGAIERFTKALEQKFLASRLVNSSVLYFYRGSAYSNNEQYDQAIADYTQAIELNPADTYAYYNRGIAYYSKKQYDQAIADYTQAITLKPDHIDAYYNRGTAYDGKEQHDQAIADYTQAIKLKQDHLCSYKSRGIAYDKIGQHDQAIADYTQAIKLKSDDFYAYFGRGLAHYNKGQYDQAIADYTQAIGLKQNYAEAYNNRGNAYHKKKQNDQAIADYTQAITLKPDDAIHYYNRGNAHDDKEQYDQAIADYTQAIGLKPGDADAYYGRGIAHYNKGQYDQSIADYTQAIKLKQDYASAYLNRGDAYRNKKQYNQAIDDYTQTIRLKPDDTDAYNKRGIAYDDKGQYNQAIADYTRAIKLKPNDADAYFLYYNRGIACDNMKLYDQAIADYTQAIRLKPDDADAYNKRGKAYDNKKQYDQAIADYNQAIKLKPDDKEAYSSAISLYHDTLFKFDRAFALNQQWLACHPDDISTQADFAENHFTMEHFDECVLRINDLLTRSEVPVSTKTALRALEIASLLALNHPNQVPVKMKALLAEVSHQPVKFEVGWSFDGTQHFISQNEKLSSYRDWLESFFNTLKSSARRDQIIKGLNKAQTRFLAQNGR